MPTFSSKISRMRSVKLPFKKRSESPPPPPARSTNREEIQYHQQQYYNNTPEPVIMSPTHITSFSETLKVISKEAKSTQFDDVFDSFFFNDKRCQNRALFMAARLKQTLDGVINPIRPSSSYGALRELHQPLVLNPSSSTPISSLSSSSSSQPRSSAVDPKLPPTISVDNFWRIVTHRLYTLNYILFVLPSDSQSRIEFLNKIEANLATIGDGQEINRRGGMEAHFAVRYALRHRRPKRRKTLLEDAFELEKRNGGNVAGAILPSSSPLPPDDTIKINGLVERARRVIEQCLESESKLGHAEKDAMYVFHSIRTGLHGAFEPHIELEEDKALRHRLKRTVNHSKEMAKPAYENPFEDEDLIVTEEDESSIESNNKREVDSGFYDGWAISST